MIKDTAVYMSLNDRLVEEYVRREQLPSLFEGATPFPARVGGLFVLIFGDWRNHEDRITAATPMGDGYASLLCGEVRVVGGNIEGRVCTLSRRACSAVRRSIKKDPNGNPVLVVEPFESKGAAKLTSALPPESRIRWRINLRDEPSEEVLFLNQSTH